MSKYLNDLKSRLSHLNYALKLEQMIDKKSLYAQDLKITIQQVQAEINQANFADANPIVMVGGDVSTVKQTSQTII